ncbi:MAG: hypothetical protein JSS02_31245, partial [Planctomycetes bacterium]|nr:hypothetical protein [Planctomycetota bacterium]
ERFEAMHANWTIDFMLQVPPERVSEATGLLQELVAQTTDAEQPGGTNSAAGLTAGLWVPLVSTLAAGSVVCFGIDRVDGRPPRRVRVQREEAPPAELWELLTAAPGPWVQPGGPGMGAKRVTFDRARKVAVIEEDLDGDGAIDRARELAWPAP